MRRRQIAGFVFLAHGLIVCMLGIDHWMHKIKQQPKKIVVHTFESLGVQPMIAMPKVLKKEACSPKKMLAKKSIEKEKVSDSLLKNIEKNLEVLSRQKEIKKTTITIPKIIPIKNQEFDCEDMPLAERQEVKSSNFERNSKESRVVQQIIAHLQESLELPEFGSVKIQVTLNASGVLQESIILETKSQKNGEFLKRRLSELRFPCLNHDTTLTIVFSNAL